MRQGFAGLLVVLALALPLPAASESVATFTLDALSFVAFGEDEILHLPAGSTLRFRFREPQPDGATPFTIDPDGVSIADVPLPGGGVLRYALPKLASGTMRATSGGREIRFTAVVRATLEKGAGGDGSYDYVIPFTTESAAAPDLARTETLQVSGMRIVEGAWYGQIVGATTNREGAFPAPGAAVTTVLSGSFDRLP